jgi:hypothetical protein
MRIGGGQKMGAQVSAKEFYATGNEDVARCFVCTMEHKGESSLC